MQKMFLYKITCESCDNFCSCTINIAKASAEFAFAPTNLFALMLVAACVLASCVSICFLLQLCQRICMEYCRICSISCNLQEQMLELALSLADCRSTFQNLQYLSQVAGVCVRNCIASHRMGGYLPEGAFSLSK